MTAAVRFVHRPGLGERLARVACAALLALVAWWLPQARRDLVRGVVKLDAAPGAPPVLPAPPPGADVAPLPPAPRTRVAIIDGLNAELAHDLPAWDALCAQGLDLEVDVGFPTVSLPVQVALWTGLTQQQTGVLYHSGLRLADPLGPRGIPAQVPGSIAVAESHPYIVQSLGFARALPPSPDGKQLPDGWAERWVGEATLAVAGDAALALVHVLRVDTAGHKPGRPSAAWDEAVASSDALLAELVAAAPPSDAVRWFVLADHGHLDGGGHAGAQRAIRRVRACVAGAGVGPVVTPGGPIALVDLARALADSVGATLSPEARGRALGAALAAPLRGDELVPATPRPRFIVAGLLLLVGLWATAAALGRAGAGWGPWWWPLAVGAAVVAFGAPDLARSYVYAPRGEAVADAVRWGTYAAAAWTAAALLLGGRSGWRVAVAQAALPVAGLLAALVLCGGLTALWGEPAPAIDPRWTAWSSVALVLTARGLAAVALALLATAVLPGFGPSAPPGTRRSAP